jgi:phage protein U
MTKHDQARATSKLDALKRAAQVRDRAELRSGEKTQKSFFLLTSEDLKRAVVSHRYTGF